MRILNLALVAALPLLAIGCGGDLFGGDGGVDGGGNVCGTGVQVYKLVAPAQYTVQSVTNINDGCMTQIDTLAGITRQVDNDNQGNILLRGSAMSVFGFGKGKVFCNTGALTETGIFQPTDQPGCSMTLTRTSNVTVTADNTMSISFTESQTMRNAQCTMPTGTSCTTTASMVWKM